MEERLLVGSNFCSEIGSNEKISLNLGYIWGNPSQ